MSVTNILIDERKNEMSDDKWMQNVHPKKGALHKQLGVPEGKKIPAKKLEKATHSKDPLLKKRAVLAETYRKANKV